MRKYPEIVPKSDNRKYSVMILFRTFFFSKSNKLDLEVERKDQFINILYYY